MTVIDWAATCRDCGWSYGNSVKSDVETQVRYHRRTCRGSS